MSLVSMNELLEHAGKHSYAVGYFESWDLYSLQATVAAAEEQNSPLILGVGGLSANHTWLREVGIRAFGPVVNEMAEKASVPIATLFNEGDSVLESEIAIQAGYGAVMMHTEGWPWEQLIADTRTVVDKAHSRAVAVEGEVGALPEITEEGLDESRASNTKVEQAVEFVSATGVDCLAVAVGNVHFVTTSFVPNVDIELIRAIDDAVDVPLVMHGGSGTPDDQMRAAIAAGITKINVGTKLKTLFGKKLRETISADKNWDPNMALGSHLDGDWLTISSAAVHAEVSRLIQVFGSNGKASS